MNWDTVRAEFPALANWTYLNTATFGQLPQRSVAAVARHFAHRDELACSDFLNWYDDMDCIRASIAKLIHCAPTDVAFISSASSGLATLIAGIDWKAGDRVITLDHEFPNNLYALGVLERGVECVVSAWGEFYDSVTDRTRLVVLSSVNYNSGFAPPLEEIGAFLRERGILFFIDGTQSVGALQFDAARVRPDMLAVHGYKWLLSPNGAGFLYVSPDLRERLRPTVIGWRSHYDWRSVDNLHHGAPEFSTSAEKYEGGGINFSLIYGMGASVDMMLELGPAAIEERVLSLAARVRTFLRGLGARVIDERSPIVSARFDNCDPSQLAIALKQRRVLVAARKGALRVSPHFYNNDADLETFEANVTTALQEMRCA